MPIRNATPISWRARGLTDADDGTDAFDGAMKTLQNVIPDPSTARAWVPRPASIEKTDFTGGPPDAGVLSARLIVGDIEYGLVPSSTNPGFDEPYAYDLANDAFLVVAGILAGNVPQSPPTSGDWVPPIMAQVAGRVIVTHPGFNSDDLVRFGWFDVSGAVIAAEGNTVSGTRYIYGNPNLLGIQPGDTVTGAGIPAGTTVVNTHPYYIGLDFVGDTHSSTVIDGIASTADLFPNLQISGSGIVPGTIIIARHPNSIDISQATTSSNPGLTIQVFGNDIMGGFDTLASTHSNTTVDGFNIVAGSGLPLGLAVGQGVSGTSILPGTTVTAVGPGNQITISVAATATVSSMHLTVEGVTIVLSQNTTATNNREAFVVGGGTRTAPLWGAGNTDNFPLPSIPVSVVQFNGRAYYACGTDGVLFSDPGLPCRISNSFGIQAITLDDGLAVTALGPLLLTAPVTGGIVQAVIIFEGANKMRQITGDQALGTLAMNIMPVATGTNAPLSIVPTELGLAFISPLGLRFIKFDGTVTPPVGVDGQGIAAPFQFAVAPSQICAAANVGVLRITVQNGDAEGEPYEEYWFDIARTAWHGPHTFPSRLIQPWRSSFVLAPIGLPGSLWQSDAFATAASIYIENEVVLDWTMETVLLPDNNQMAMNAVVESNLMSAMDSDDVLAVSALDEDAQLLDAISVLPGQLSSRFRQRGLYWSEPLIFKQMSVRIAGESNGAVKIGNLYLRYEILGYTLPEPESEDFFLLDDTGLIILQTETPTFLTPD